MEADFYRPEQLLVLRDNGIGMTFADLMERWLVVGTDSKLSSNAEMEEVASALGMQTRVPTGEKGIGRLAIAAIGPQVLLVSIARRSDRIHPAVALFVNWTLFELPGISLDEIEVPVREFSDGQLPTAEDVSALVDAVRQNLARLRGRVDVDSAKKIAQQLDQVSIDVEVLQRRFQSATIGDSTTGTQFYIQPTDPMLEISLDAKTEGRRIGALQKILTGFTNTMMPDRPAPVIGDGLSGS